MYKAVLILIICAADSLSFLQNNTSKNPTSMINNTNVSEIPSIEGTYHLINWKVKGASNMELPPIQKGTLTYTKDHRIFTFISQNKDGSFSSELYVAKYILNSKEYTEIPQYLVLTNQSEKTTQYHPLNNLPVSSPVTVTGGKTRFALPHDFEKKGNIVVEFKGDEIIATADNVAEYYWKRER